MRTEGPMATINGRAVYFHARCRESYLSGIHQPDSRSIVAFEGVVQIFGVFLRVLAVVAISLLLFLGLFLGYLTVPLLILMAFVSVYAAAGSLLQRTRKRERGANYR